MALFPDKERRSRRNREAAAYYADREKEGNQGLAQAAPPTDAKKGWKPDPLGGDGLRYWDGFYWTERVGTKPESWSAAAATNQRPPIKFYWSMVCGAIAFLFFIGVFTCTNGPFATEDCSVTQGSRIGLVFVAWVIGFFLIWAIEETRASRKPASSSDQASNHPAPSDVDPLDSSLTSLERLGALHKEGVLTDEEFAEKKSEILARKKAPPQ